MLLSLAESGECGCCVVRSVMWVPVGGRERGLWVGAAESMLQGNCATLGSMEAPAEGRGWGRMHKARL